MVEVVAALIWDNDKFMICQRPKNKARALLWEFVGGKVEPGETKEQALIRECQEELDITLTVGDEFMNITHEYPDITVHLTLFNATIKEGVPTLIEHNDLNWITPEEIHNYKFCPADEEILKRIQITKHKERTITMKKAYDFLKEAGTYYIATVDGDQPRVRPFGTVNIFEDKLYIQTGKGKAVNDQILASGKVELCAMKGDEWIRVSGTLVLDERVEAGEAMLDAYPYLRNMYTTGENGNSVVYYFKDATAVISAFGHAPEIIRF